MFRYRHRFALRCVLPLATVILALDGTVVSAADPVGKAGEYIEKGDTNAAVMELKNLLQRDPGDVRGRLLLGALYLRLGKGAVAEKELLRASELGADPTQWELYLAEAMLLQGKFSDVLGRLDDTVEASAEEQSRAMALRGRAHLGLNQLDDAASDFAQAVKLDPDSRKAAFGEVLLALANNKLEQAAEAADRFLARFPDNADALLIRADLYRKAGEVTQAGELFARVMRLEPDNVRAILGHATTMIASDNIAQAEADLDLADEIREGLGMADYLRGVIAFREREWDEASEHLQKVLAKTPDHAQSQLLMGMVSFTKGDLKNKELDEALNASEALERRMPDSAIAHNLAGLAFLAKGDRETARGRFNKALELDPEFVTASLNLARVDLEDDDLDGARNQYENILRKKAGHLGAMLGMAAVAQKRKDSEGMVSWLEKAQRANRSSIQPGSLLVRHYIAGNEPMKALPIASELAERFPENPQVLEMLAQAQTLVGDTSNAIRTFEQLAKLRPEDARARYFLGAVKWKAEDLSGARDAFRKAIELKPGFLKARVSLANLELQEGRVGEALAIAKQLQQEHPDAAGGYQLEARVYRAQDKDDEALAAMEMAYSRRKSSEILHELAQIYAAVDRREDAIKLLEDWTKEEPEDQTALVLLATYYQQSGRDGEATKAYESLLQKNPENALILNNLAWLYQEQGDPRAIDTARKAYGLAPERAEVADTYGWTLVNNGTVREGLSILQQAYVSYPTQREIGYHVAVALHKAGRDDEALRVLHGVLRQALDFPNAQDARALLQELEQ